MSRSILLKLILILVTTMMELSLARKSDKGSNIIIISPPASNPDPQMQSPPPGPFMMPQPQFQMPPPPMPTFGPPPPLSLPYPLPMPSMANFMHRSGLLSPPSLPPPMPSINRELLRNLLASSSMNMGPDYPVSDMAMESSMHSENFMSLMDPHQKMLQALLPNFLVLPIKVPQNSMNSYSNSGRGSRHGKIPKSIADLMAMNQMSMEESSKKESIMNSFNDSVPEAHRRSSGTPEYNGHPTADSPPPTWEPSAMDLNDPIW